MIISAQLVHYRYWKIWCSGYDHLVTLLATVFIFLFGISLRQVFCFHYGSSVLTEHLSTLLFLVLKSIFFYIISNPQLSGFYFYPLRYFLYTKTKICSHIWCDFGHNLVFCFLWSDAFLAIFKLFSSMSIQLPVKHSGLEARTIWPCRREGKPLVWSSRLGYLSVPAPRAIQVTTAHPWTHFWLPLWKKEQWVLYLYGRVIDLRLTFFFLF